MDTSVPWASTAPLSRPSEKRRQLGLEWRHRVPLADAKRMAQARSPPRSGRNPHRAGQEPDRGAAAGALCADEVRPVCFLRGAAAIMAADLATLPATGLRVQSCGDCHLANFGAYASPEGTPVFDINDFDETLPAPFEWDVKRLATSLAVAGRAARMPEDECRQLSRLAARNYRRHMARLARLPPLDAVGHAHRSCCRDRRYQLSQDPPQRGEAAGRRF